MKFLIPLLLSLLLVFTGAMNLDVEAQSGPNIAKLAKDFSVSPKQLTKFSKKGLNIADLGNGLKIARDASKIKNLKMEDVLEKVLGSKADGKNWPDIAGDFGIELPKDFSPGK